MGYLPLPYNKDRNKVFYKEMDNGLIYMGDVFTYIIATGLLLTNRWNIG